MKGKILLSGVLVAGMICSMAFSSDMDLMQKNPMLKCIREAGVPVTAMTMYNDDRCAICGDMDGNLIRISSDGYEKMENTGLGRIDSIVLGKVPEGIACFTVQGGSLYEHNKGNIINVSGAWKEKVKGVYKGKYGKRIYAATEKGNVYAMSKDGIWNKVPEKKIKQIIKEITSESNRVLSYSDGSIVCLSSGGSVKFAYSKDGKIYAEDPYEPKLMSAKVSYVSDAVGYSERAIYRISIEGRRLLTNNKYKLDEIFGNGYNGFKYTLSCENDTRYDKDAYPILGAIYNSDGDKAALQNREISFLWIGPKLKENEQRKLIVKEWAYDFSSKDISGNNGMAKNIDQIEVDLPEPVAMPDYSSYYVNIITDGESNKKIDTYPNGVCGKLFYVVITDENMDPVDPGEEVYDHLAFYIEKKGTYADENKLIGSDPSKPGYTAIIPESYVEINEYVKYGSNRYWKEYDARGFYVYYNNNYHDNIIVGLVDNNGVLSNYSAAADFEIRAKDLPVSIIVASVSGMNNPDGRSFSFYPKIAGSNWKGDKMGNGAGYLDYQLTGLANDGDKKNQGIFVYLPEGYNTRDSQARKDLRSISLTPGYYCDPLLSTGKNASPEDPMLADEYKVYDTPSYCRAMLSRYLYAMFFDQYGRCVVYKDTKEPYPAGGAMVTIEDEENKTVKEYNLWDLRDESDFRNLCKPEELNMEVVVRNLHKTPIIVSSKMDSYPQFARDEDKKPAKYGITEGGVFIPPFTNTDTKKYDNACTFMTDKTEWLRAESAANTIEHFGISGHLFNENSNKVLFANFFSVSSAGACSVKLQFAQLNNDGTGWQDENKPFDPSQVQSYISTNIFHPAAVITSQMRELYFVYAPKDTIKDKITYHNLSSDNNKYTGERCVVSGSAEIATFPADDHWWPSSVKQSLPK